MFTGIIQSLGSLAAKRGASGSESLKINLGDLASETIALGDSIACNGVCLTATAFESDCAWVDVSPETLRLTTLGALPIGAPLNLELAMQPQSRLGGHIVSGHVDGIGSVTAIEAQGAHVVWRFELPSALSRYIAAKGSITIDGVSLTVNDVDQNRFSVNIIPTTFRDTVFKCYEVGSNVNLEVDIIARYVERLMQAKGDDASAGLTLDTLHKAGFTG